MSGFALYSTITPADTLKLLQALETISKKNGLDAAKFVPVGALYSDYVHPNKGNLLFIINIVLAAITLAFVLARLYTRLNVAGGLGGDDYTIVVATVVVLGSTVMNCYGVKAAGFGRHFYDITVEETRTLLKIAYALPMVYTTGVLLIKLSILLFYRRLFPSNARMQQICLWFMAFQVAFTVGTCLAFAFMCTPVHGWWDLELRAESCPTFQDTMYIYVSLRVVTVICDIIVVALPMKMVLGLKIPPRQRIGLAFLFGLGILTCGIAIARLALLPRLLLTLDVSWNVLPVALLDQAEQCLGIVTASIPALAALFSRQRDARGKSANYATSSSLELGNRRRATTPNQLDEKDFDFLAFAFDPEAHGVSAQRGPFSCAYSGGQKRPRPPGARDSTITIGTESDEQLLRSPDLRALAGINKTTTVTVNISKNPDM